VVLLGVPDRKSPFFDRRQRCRKRTRCILQRAFSCLWAHLTGRHLAPARIALTSGAGLASGSTLGGNPHKVRSRISPPASSLPVLLPVPSCGNGWKCSKTLPVTAVTDDCRKLALDSVATFTTLTLGAVVGRGFLAFQARH